jgi:hypothetical protein
LRQSRSRLDALLDRTVGRDLDPGNAALELLAAIGQPA